MDPAFLSASFQDFDAHLSRLEDDYVQRLEAGFAQRSEAGYAQRLEAGYAQRLEAGYAQRSEAGYATGLEAGYPKNLFLPSSLNEGVSFLVNFIRYEIYNTYLNKELYRDRAYICTLRSANRVIVQDHV